MTALRDAAEIAVCVLVAYLLVGVIFGGPAWAVFLGFLLIWERVS